MCVIGVSPHKMALSPSPNFKDRKVADTSVEHRNVLKLPIFCPLNHQFPFKKSRIPAECLMRVLRRYFLEKAASHALHDHDRTFICNQPAFHHFSKTFFAGRGPIDFHGITSRSHGKVIPI
jgi:hypothetical protein